MRECHPDLSQDEESLEFSTVINEIYEVLRVDWLPTQQVLANLHLLHCVLTCHSEVLYMCRL